MLQLLLTQASTVFSTIHKSSIGSMTFWLIWIICLKLFITVSNPLLPFWNCQKYVGWFMVQFILAGQEECLKITLYSSLWFLDFDKTFRGKKSNNNKRKRRNRKLWMIILIIFRYMKHKNQTNPTATVSKCKKEKYLSLFSIHGEKKKNNISTEPTSLSISSS